MNTLYIGQYTEGTTSRMRANEIEKRSTSFAAIDTNVPFLNAFKLWRSIGFRYKLGPIIKRINQYILKNIPQHSIDICWVDKGIFLLPSTILVLKKKCSRLLHYTPDTAFYQNASRLFNSSSIYYDLLVTTKSFDLEKYKTLVPSEKVLLVTQGYDPHIHQPYVEFKNKKKCVTFIGLAEPSREKLIQGLLNSGIEVKLAGYNWEKFVRHQPKLNKITYMGKVISGAEYSKTLSESMIGLGLVSKRFPELHTTRTFEIPACGTALATEANIETKQFFNSDQAIFYDSSEKLIESIDYYFNNLTELESLTYSGYETVTQGSYTYSKIIEKIINKIAK